MVSQEYDEQEGPDTLGRYLLVSSLVSEKKVKNIFLVSHFHTHGSLHDHIVYSFVRHLAAVIKEIVLL